MVTVTVTQPEVSGVPDPGTDRHGGCLREGFELPVVTSSGTVTVTSPAVLPHPPQQ